MSALPALKRHDWFFTGGGYIDDPAGARFANQMYVERFTPTDVKRPHPVVMVHGGMQTGTNFTMTADGRPGWVYDFVAAGYEVLVVDQPERGRSGHRAEAGQVEPQTRYTAERTADMFTAPADAALYPQAAKHARWPGTGRRGDAVFDRFYASQVGQLSDRTEVERLARDGLAALLDEIGPAILLTHSQSGAIGWCAADARPALTKAVLSIEPNGPPFKDVRHLGAPDWFAYGDDDARAWGITRLPLAFDPPAASPADLAPMLQVEADGPNLAPGYLPSGPQRRLVNLAGLPILIVSGEASYHACYDHLTSRFLTWAGVDHAFVRLEDRGLTGNGHMIMMEENSSEVAGLLIDWLSDQNL